MARKHNRIFSTRRSKLKFLDFQQWLSSQYYKTPSAREIARWASEHPTSNISTGLPNEFMPIKKFQIWHYIQYCLSTPFHGIDINDEVYFSHDDDGDVCVYTLFMMACSFGLQDVVDFLSQELFVKCCTLYV